MKTSTNTRPHNLNDSMMTISKIMLIGYLYKGSAYHLPLFGYSHEENLLSEYYKLGHDMWFPIMWHFDKCRLKQACAASF